MIPEVKFSEIADKIIQDYVDGQVCPVFMVSHSAEAAQVYYDRLLRAGRAVKLVHATNDKGGQAYCIIKREGFTND